MDAEQPRNTPDTPRGYNMPSISSQAVVQTYLLPLIARVRHAVRARQASPPPAQPRFKSCGPPFRSPHTVPTEIILQIADLLDEASLLALRHTNRDLLYIISLTPDQNARLREVYRLTALRRLTAGYDTNRLVFCASCQEARPLSSFSASEVMALDRLQQASCSRHSRFWVCPHVSYNYQSLMQLPRIGIGYCGIDEQTGHPDCGHIKCRCYFHHRSFTARPWSGYGVKSIIVVAIASGHGGTGMMRDTIQRHCTKAIIHEALANFHAPICDHHLLSDEKVRDAYDPNDIDFDDHDLGGACPPREHMRTVRKSDRSCSLCQAAGVETRFRFLGQAYQGLPNLDISLVVIRYLGARSRRSQDQAERYRQCHGVTERRFARFRDGWVSGTEPYKVVASFDESTADS